MTKQECGNILREQRDAINKLSVEEVSNFLKNKGYKANKSTIYSWENGNSFPSPDIFLELCSLYGIKDVLSTFNYKSSFQNKEAKIDNPDIIAKYSKLDEYGKNSVTNLINNEFERCLSQDRKNIEYSA